jgi:hypothetical protein
MKKTVLIGFLLTSAAIETRGDDMPLHDSRYAADVEDRDCRRRR